LEKKRWLKMDFFRLCFDKFYDFIKPVVFYGTKKDPEKAYDLFVSFCKVLYKSKLEKIVLDNESNKIVIPFELSNAAGFNKNGEIPPSVLKYMGFDRIVVGTVTNEGYKGNPKPRCIRYPETESLVNWMGFPCDGSKVVSERLISYGDHGIPLTMNIMSTPKKQGDDLLKDLESTILDMRDVPYVDRFELNISCPNTFSCDGSLDARSEYSKQLGSMVDVIESLLYPEQSLYIKVSPDIDEFEVIRILSVSYNRNVEGFTISNISTKQNPKLAKNSSFKGGISGNAMYAESLRVQRLFFKKMMKDYKIIACGGINSVEKIKERIFYDAKGIQIYTPLIFSGPKIIKELRKF